MALDSTATKHALFLGLLSLIIFSASPVLALDTRLVSEPLDAPVPWDFGDDTSDQPLVSADGGTVVFTSTASNLIPGQRANPFAGPYRWNETTNEVSAIGIEPNADLVLQSISSDGQWVGLLSHATNLLDGSLSARPPLGAPFPAQPYLLNTRTGSYQKLDTRATNVVVSPDGRRVALSRQNASRNTNHVMVHDLASGTITNITPDANNASHPVEFSSNGNLLAFIARASNLAVPATPNGQGRAYLYDFTNQSIESLARETGVSQMSISGDAASVILTTFTVERDDRGNFTGTRTQSVVLDRAAGTTQVLLPTELTSVVTARSSTDGRWVSIVTTQSLIASDTNTTEDLYLFDRSTDELIRLTSDDLRLDVRALIRATLVSSKANTKIAFGASGNSYIYHIESAELERVSAVNGEPVAWGGDGVSTAPQISDDGGLITFLSEASNLTAGESDEGEPDIYGYSRNSAAITQLSAALPTISSTGINYALSATGRYVAYSNVRDDALRLVDRNTGIERLLLQALGLGALDISADGRYIAFSAILQEQGFGVFLVDTQTSELRQLAPVSGNDVLISGNGNLVLFSSFSNTLIDNYPNPSYRRNEFFTWDRTTQQIEILVEGGLDAIAQNRPWLSHDGNRVVFSTDACYQYDRQTRFVTRFFASLESHCDQPDLSQDERFVVFSSPANDVVSEGNVPNQAQLYVHDRLNDTTALLTPHGELEPRAAFSSEPAISGDGGTIAFQSSLESLTPDGNNLSDVFVLPNPLSSEDPDDESVVFMATLRANSRVVDLHALWPADAQLTQVRELAIPGGVLFEGAALEFNGEYAVPPGVEIVTFNSRYFVDGAAFGSTNIELQIPSDDSQPTPPSPATGGVLEGFVWLDANGDGHRDTEEAAEVGRDIDIFRCGPPWGVAASATSVAPMGRWRVTDLEPGEYQIGTEATGVEFSPVINDNLVFPNGFSNCVFVDDNASGIAPEIGMGLLAVAATDNAGIRGRAWLDSNSDGVRDANESPDVGRSVTAFRCEAPWGSVGQAVTDAAGNFEISGVVPAHYQLGVVVDGVGFSPVVNDNDIHPNGFSNCIDFSQANAQAGIGVIR